MRKLAQMAQISVTDEEVCLVSHSAVKKGWMLHRDKTFASQVRDWGPKLEQIVNWCAINMCQYCCSILPCPACTFSLQ